MAWTSTASTELDLPNGAKIYEGTFDAICGNFGHIGGTTGLDWIDWTPTVDQGGAVAVTVNRAHYMRVHNTVIAGAIMTVTGSGTSGNNIRIQGWPTTITPSIASTGKIEAIGTGIIVDAGITNIYVGSAYFPTSTAMQIVTDGTIVAVGAGAFSLSSSDTIGFTVIYRST